MTEGGSPEQPIFLLEQPHGIRKAAAIAQTLILAGLFAFLIPTEDVKKRILLITVSVLSALLVPASPMLLKLIFHRELVGIATGGSVAIFAFPFQPLIVHGRPFDDEQIANLQKRDVSITATLSTSGFKPPYLRFLLWLNRMAHREEFQIGGYRSSEVSDVSAEIRAKVEEIYRQRENGHFVSIHIRKQSEVTGPPVQPDPQERIRKVPSQVSIDENQFLVAPIGSWTTSDGSVGPMDDFVMFRKDGQLLLLAYRPLSPIEFTYRWRAKSPGVIEVAEEGSDTWWDLSFTVTGPNEAREYILTYETDHEELSLAGFLGLRYRWL